jgi:DNA-binding transcriptional regulator GbsR (MarR family)
MNNQYISINDTVTTYKISQSKTRQIVKGLNGTKHIKKVGIKGRHGFKYLISVAYLDSLLSDVKTSEINSKNENLDNALNSQLISENKQLTNTVNKQFETIKSLTNTIQEQNKIVIAQSLQIHRLNEPHDHDTNKKTLTIELLIISVLMICIVIVIIYLFR